MAKVKGLFQRGKVWWLRYTPAPNAKQERISLETTNEEVAAIKAIGIPQAVQLGKVTRTVNKNFLSAEIVRRGSGRTRKVRQPIGERAMGGTDRSSA